MTTRHFVEFKLEDFPIPVSKTYVVLRQGVRVEVTEVPLDADTYEKYANAYDDGWSVVYVHAIDADEARERGIEVLDQYERDTRTTL